MSDDLRTQTARKILNGVFCTQPHSTPMGRAALGPLFTGQPHAFFLSPFNSRRLVQLFMQPDTAYRRTNATTHDLVLRAEPLLFPLPFNYDLPADLVDTEQSFANRQSRCEEVADRFAQTFATSAPTYEIKAFNKT